MYRDTGAATSQPAPDPASPAIAPKEKSAPRAERHLQQMDPFIYQGFAF